MDVSSASVNIFILILPFESVFSLLSSTLFANPFIRFRHTYLALSSSRKPLTQTSPRMNRNRGHSFILSPFTLLSSYSQSIIYRYHDHTSVRLSAAAPDAVYVLLSQQKFVRMAHIQLWIRRRSVSWKRRKRMAHDSVSREFFTDCKSSWWWFSGSGDTRVPRSL